VKEPVLLLSIGEVSRKAGMRASRIRYYESIGLLPPPARISGRRRYDDDVLRRLTIIPAAQRIGFTLEEIGQLLGPGKRPPHERLRVLAIDKLPAIEELISRAVTIRKLLVTCAVCDCESLDQCTILDKSNPNIPVRQPRQSHARPASRGPIDLRTASASPLGVR
jgi:MerR family redox-sensitive transcriptional activator SoxR